jgi:hypothetical protein
MIYPLGFIYILKQNKFKPLHPIHKALLRDVFKSVEGLRLPMIKAQVLENLLLEMICITSWNYYRTCRNKTFHFNRSFTSNINDFVEAVRQTLAKNCFFAYRTPSTTIQREPIKRHLQWCWSSKGSRTPSANTTT